MLLTTLLRQVYKTKLVYISRLLKSKCIVEKRLEKRRKELRKKQLRLRKLEKNGDKHCEKFIEFRDCKRLLSKILSFELLKLNSILL